KHPLGHGRVEYISAAIIAAVILYAGVTALVEAVKRIISPEKPEYTVFTFAVVAVSVLIKIVLGTFTVREGKKLSSEALVNSGRDALLDAVISTSVLVAAVIFRFFGINLEAYLAVIISAVIIRAGIGMFAGTISKIMGERVSGDLSRSIKETVCEEDGVCGAYDLILNSYGPDLLIGSVNIEVPDSWRADRIDAVSRRIADRVEREHGVVLTAIGVYSLNVSDDGTALVREPIVTAVRGIEHVLSIHGFYCNEAEKTVRFDVVVDFGVKDEEKLREEVENAARDAAPGYSVSVHVDYDYSD
ncbi:MAG: cation diffusion facilitator family transporter, partial [Clostridia bacterium]|nr:cation diffusion facilitator family transporter [Clostridia bacterium]